MKIKEGYVANKLGDRTVVVAVGKESLNFSGIIRLNGTGDFIWNLLQQECEEKQIVEELMGKYGIEQARAEEDVRRFLGILRNAGVLDEE